MNSYSLKHQAFYSVKPPTRSLRMHNARKVITSLRFCKKFPGWMGGRYELKPFEGVAPGSSVAAASGVASVAGCSQAQNESALIPIAQFSPHPLILQIRTGATNTSPDTSAKENTPPLQSPLRAPSTRPHASAQELFARQCEKIFC